MVLDERFPAEIVGRRRRRRRRRNERDDDVCESADDELVGVAGIQRKITQKQLIQEFPISLGVARFDHFNHRLPEIGVRVRRECVDGDAAAHDGVGIPRQRWVERVDDGVGGAGGGEEEAVGGEGGGEIGDAVVVGVGGGGEEVFGGGEGAGFRGREIGVVGVV